MTCDLIYKMEKELVLELCRSFFVCTNQLEHHFHVCLSQSLNTHIKRELSEELLIYPEGTVIVCVKIR